MAKAKKTPKKGNIKSAGRKISSSKYTRTDRHRTISFLVGIVTVVVIALVVLMFSLGNNYKNSMQMDDSLMPQNNYQAK
jgi:hypothetical protein